MTDWHMVVETFPERPSQQLSEDHARAQEARRDRAASPRRVRAVHAARGQFTYQDHGTPWSTVGRNLDVTLYRSDVNNDYRGNASFSNGTISIQSYEPFSASMRSRFKLVDGKVTLRSHRPDQRGCGLGHRWRGRSGALAGADLPHQVAHRLPDAEEHLLPPRSLQRLRPGGLPGNVPSLQGGPRAEGHLHQSAGRRERLALPEPARRRALAARQARDHGFDERAVRRHCPLRLPDGADRQER